MLTISLHGIRLHAKVGLYPEEKITGNEFEIDVDVFVNVTHENAFPFIDYSLIEQMVAEAFAEPGELLESFVRTIHGRVKEKFPENDRVRVAVRKLNPPLATATKYSQVCFEA